MIIVIEWLKANWRYVLCGALGIVIGIYIPRGGQKPEIEVKASQAQSGSIVTASHISIKPMPAIGPCPQLPEITVDCGGKAEGSQGQALTVTSQVPNKAPIRLFVGGGVVLHDWTAYDGVYGELGVSVGQIAIPLRVDTAKRLSVGVTYRFQ